MKFDVDWEEDVLSALASLWLFAADRAALTQAQASVDRLLAKDPIGNGIALSEGIYAIEVPPLRVLYEVNEGARSVKVVAAKRSSSQDNP
jgi:hypothetical protein